MNRVSSLLLIALAAAACSRQDSITSPAPATSVSDGQGAASSSGGYYGATATARVRVEIALTANGSVANARGKAKYDDRGARRELQVEIENVAAGTAVNFYVNGVQVGTTQTTDAFQKASVNLSTQLGQVVPVIKTGDVVDVKTAAGASLVTGKF